MQENYIEQSYLLGKEIEASEMCQNVLRLLMSEEKGHKMLACSCIESGGLHDTFILPLLRLVFEDWKIGHYSPHTLKLMLKKRNSLGNYVISKPTIDKLCQKLDNGVLIGLKSHRCL